MSKIRVLIADDHAIVRMGLTALFDATEDIAVVGEAEDGADAVRKAVQLKPDVIVMDLMMPVMDGISAIREIREKVPESRTLVLTTSSSSDDIDRALKAGAAGAMTKNTANQRLLAAIRTIAGGERVLSNEVAQMIQDDPPVPGLTDRQREILQDVANGMTNREIADRLKISPDGIKDHISAICAKLGANNRSEAVAIALRKHLIKA